MSKMLAEYYQKIIIIIIILLAMALGTGLGSIIRQGRKGRNI
jgi:hypothetical protein